jgi:hypothetical protein
MNKLLTILCICCFFKTIKAQPFSAYTNARKEFYTFDNGGVNRIEPLEPISYKIGKRGIAYMDNARNFKVYHNGTVTQLSDLFNTAYHVSDDFITYHNRNILNVIDGTEIKTLSNFCTKYAMGDSIVVFYDYNKSIFSCYYNGEIIELETFLLTNSENDFVFDSTVKVTDNIVAYVNYNNTFNVFLNNKHTVLEDNIPKDFQVGRNTVAYTTINNQFKIFHKGNIYDIDVFPPKNITVGDDLVAFETTDGYFKYFYDGKLYTMGLYEPQYKLVDNVLAYEDINNRFTIFHKGETYFMDIYFPEKLNMQYNSLAYVNKTSTLRLFSNGKIADITTMPVNNFQIDYDVLKYQIGFNAFHFYKDGKHY